MNLNQQQKRGLFAFAIILIVYIAITFIIPFKHGFLFWIGWIFGLIAILLQLVFIVVAAKGAASARSRFYGWPIVKIGLLYLIVQLVVSIAAMAFGFLPKCPAWPFALVSILLLAAAALGLIAADITRDEVVRQDHVLKTNTVSMRSLQSIGRILSDQSQDPELRLLVEELQYADPVSGSATEEIEKELSDQLTRIQQAIKEGHTHSIKDLCAQARDLLAERNRICRLNK